MWDIESSKLIFVSCYTILQKNNLGARAVESILGEIYDIQETNSDHIAEPYGFASCLVLSKTRLWQQL